MRKKLLAIVMSAVLAFSTLAFSVGCSSGDGGDQQTSSTGGTVTKDGVDITDWDAVEAAARGTTVNFYGYGGDESFNNFMTGTVKDYMKEHYDITFNWYTVDLTDKVVTMVSDEKQAGAEEGEGATDLMWLGSWQFQNAKEQGLCYPNILQNIPNVEKYVADDNPVLTEFSEVSSDNMAVPWDPTQYVMIHDSAQTSWYPKNTDELLEWAKEYKGLLTYPSTDQSYGKNFVWMVMCDLLGEDWYKDLDENSSYEEVKAACEPALEYLRELNPYLWKEGKSYPTSSGQQIELFASGEIGFCLDWVPYSVGAHVKDGTFTETTEAFVFDSGMIESWDGILAIPYDCANVPGAMVTINSLITPELGYAMLEETGYPPAIDVNKLSDEEKEIAESVDVGTGSLTQEEVANLKKIDWAPYWMIDTLDELWQNEVRGQYND